MPRLRQKVRLMDSSRTVPSGDKKHWKHASENSTKKTKSNTFKFKPMKCFASSFGLDRPGPLTSPYRSKANAWGAPGPPIPFRKLPWQWMWRCVVLGFPLEGWRHKIDLFFSRKKRLKGKPCKVLGIAARKPITHLVYLHHLSHPLQWSHWGVWQIASQGFSKLFGVMQFWLGL